MKEENEKKETELLQKLPEFGHQLKIYSCSDVEGWVGISPSAGQKLRSFLLIFVQGLLLSVGVLAILFGPDFLLDYSQRETDFVQFFWKFFVFAVLFVTIISVVVMVMRMTSIFIHPAKKNIVCASRLTSKAASECVPISTIEKLDIEPPSQILKRSRIVAHIREGDVVLAESYGDNEDLIALRDWLLELKS